MEKQKYLCAHRISCFSLFSNRLLLSLLTCVLNPAPGAVNEGNAVCSAELWAQKPAKKNALKMSVLAYERSTWWLPVSSLHSQCRYHEPSRWRSVPLKILSGQQEEGLNASPSELVRSVWPPDMLCRRQMRQRRRNTGLCPELALSSL